MKQVLQYKGCFIFYDDSQPYPYIVNRFGDDVAAFKDEDDAAEFIYEVINP